MYSREHDSGCPGARFRLPLSTIQLARERNLALPWIGCPGARSWLPGSTFREHNLALPVISRRAQRLPGSTGFFLEDLSYRFLTLQVSEREFVIRFWRSIVRGACARACSRSGIFQGFCRHSAGCPGARSRLPGSAFQVAREHNLALPSMSGIG